MRTLRFLITPNYAAPYDRRMVAGLANGLRSIGHQAFPLTGPIDPNKLSARCNELSVDVVIQINRTRPNEVPLPPSVRYVSWFQDVFPDTNSHFADSFQHSDILYSLGDAEVLGLKTQLPCFVGSLVCGVDDSVFQFKPLRSTNDIDFSLCGFIPPPLQFFSRFDRLVSCMPSVMASFVNNNIRRDHVPIEIRTALMNTVEELYHPLRGNLDIHSLANELRKKIEGMDTSWQSSYSRRMHRAKLSPLERQISYFVREHPRLIDRVSFLNKVIHMSTSLELYGPGWTSHPEFKPYAKGTINTQDDLLEVYRRSRLNLANNTHGLGLHSRTLECMAVGGFIFTHESPNDLKPGGMLTAFEPGLHFGSFSPENLREEALRWLNLDAHRLEAGRRASTLVYQQHRWQHRAQQIDADLKR